MSVSGNILLVGSVPLPSAEAVFEAVAAGVGPRAKRLPDGETGERTNWIAWQRAIFAGTAGLEASSEQGPAPRFAVRPDHRAPIRFGPLGYADAALSSWAVFRRLKREGRIGTDHRFQVSLPTPFATVALYVEPGSQAAVEEAYRDRLLDEARRIVDAIPAEELAIQWDVAAEFAVLEGLAPVHFATEPDAIRAGLLDRLTGLADLVPEPVELGYHLCYGDSGHKHFKEPADTRLLVEVANGLAAGVGRRLDWIHMPVPRDRDDDAYFEALSGLALQPETELYLGLVHYSDGEEGRERRIAAAQRHVSGFGIATECGFGRRPPEQVAPLLALHLR